MASYRLKPTLGTAPLMSALGQKQTSGHVQSMSALPPKADITECDRHVRFVRKADSCAAAKASLYTLLIGPVAGKPSGALYQHQGPRQPATSYNRQCRLWLNTPLPPRTRLQNHIEPQQTGGNYEDTGLKIMIDPLASGSPSFDQPTCQIEAESNNKGCIAIAAAMLIKETTLQSATPGTRNAKIIAVSAMAPDCQRIMIAMRIARSN